MLAIQQKQIKELEKQSAETNQLKNEIDRLNLTVVTTLRQQRRGVLEFLTAAGRAEVATIVTVIQESRGLSLLPSAS